MNNVKRKLELAEALSYDDFYLEKLIKIPDRNGHTIAFKMNAAQEIVVGILNGGYTRILVIKAGQLGITTGVLGKYLKDTLQNKNLTTVIVAHEEYITQRLLTRLKFMYDNIPDTVAGIKVKPKMHHDSSYEKTFPSLNSAIYIGTAGAKVIGRGDPMQRFHGSEVAFWKDPDNVLVPSMQRVPMDGIAVLESTPNGEGDHDLDYNFYDMVQEAAKGNSIWKLVCLEWWLEPEYRLPIGSPHAATMTDRARITNYTPEEEALCRRAGWNDFEADERIRWRRRKQKEIKRMFYQEFFEDLATCFLAIKDPYYDGDIIATLQEEAFPAPFSYNNAQVWEKPAHLLPEESPDYSSRPEYIISIDPGQGKVSRSVAEVWRLDQYPIRKHVATLAGMYVPEVFAPQVCELGMYYKHAKLVPEANGHGMAFCNQECIVRYGNVYYREDVISGRATKAVGWYSTGAARVNAKGTKIYAMAQLQNILPYIKTWDRNLISELGQVRYNGDQIIFVGSNDYHDAAIIFAATEHTVMGNQNSGFVGVAGGWDDKW